MAYVKEKSSHCIRHRPKACLLSSDKENRPPTPRGASRLYGGTPQSVERLSKPFRCPGSNLVSSTSNRPARKKRKISYKDTDGSVEDGDKPYSNDDRLALVTRDVNRFPVFKAKDRVITFKQRFNVPLINKDVGSYNSCRPAPLLGMRLGNVFIPKPLHDPSGEFAIVLYDPTVDDKPAEKCNDEVSSKKEEPKPKIDVPLVHKSLADILGIKKKVDEEHPRVPVVIDPRLSKVLRPHQVEGVKVCNHVISSAQR